MFGVLTFCITFVSFLKLKNIVLLFNLKKKMKKLVLMLAVVFSASLFSCNNSKEEAAATDTLAADTIEVAAEVDTLVVADSAAADTIVAETVAVAE